VATQGSVHENGRVAADFELLKMGTTKAGFFGRHMRALLAALCAVAVTGPAHAGGSVTGTVSLIETLGSGSGAPGGLDFRVHFAGDPVFCGGYTWAYVNVTDANYNTIVANVLTARATGAAITVIWIAGSTGYCQISSVQW
jgi:hypothetical protein